MKLIWISDPHLEFLTSKQLEAFLQSLVTHQPEAVLITGDISTAGRIESHLSLLGAVIPVPVYFLLGNHDFYGGCFSGVETVVHKVCSEHSNLFHLGSGEIVKLGENTVLIGHRGWADGRAGLGDRSQIVLNDVNLIDDLMGLEHQALYRRLRQLADDSAEYVRGLLPLAASHVDNLILGTHVPPFPDAALYQGKPSDPGYAPHFVNVALGKVLMEFAASNPEKKISVLCGHTHHRAVFQPLANLTVKVAYAEYGRPEIAEVLSLQA